MPNILVVDDNPSILELASFALSKHGFHVETAGDAREGLIKASGKFDLIITDILMPLIDGWNFVRLLRAWPETAFIPCWRSIVSVSALGAALMVTLPSAAR